MSTARFKKIWFWRMAYKFYPPFLRVLERIRFHRERQPFLLGKLKSGIHIQELEAHALAQGYEHVLLAWMDPGELLSMRKVDREIYQYHLRVFDDGEIRCHYEYSSEGNAWGHITEKCFEPRSSEFKAHLGHFLHSDQ
jgi:hypothetical protein